MAQEQRIAVVETVSLTKVYKDFWGRDKVKAVDDLNLEIHQGEVFGLLGPNGSGKTTTIKMLLGLLYPTRGRARVFAKDPSDVEVKSRIGYLPEETRLYQFLDSRETLDFYSRLFKLNRSERRRRSDALVDMVGLSPAASRPVGQYSKGMARRIGLAQSLVNDPDFLILDEPTAGMDPIGTRQIKDLILELRKRGKTILLSSHLLADVEDVCDRVAIMYGGKLLCCGPVKDLLSQDEMTEVLTERLDEKEVEELRGYILDHFGRDVVSVGSHRDRLEPFFLKIVAQAQAQQFATSGALAGGKVSDFFKAIEPPQGEELLHQLTEAVDPALVNTKNLSEAPRDTAGQTRRREVLDDLMGEKSESAAESIVEVERVEPVDRESRKIDSSVLEDLLKTSDGEEGQAPSKTGGS